MTSRQPTTWEQYERGASPGRSDSPSSVRFEDQGLLDDQEASGNDYDWRGRLRRRYVLSLFQLNL
jgi:vesicular inhibitory amino acid transporter